MDIEDLINEKYEGMFGFGINTKIGRIFHQLFDRVENQEDKFNILY